MKLGAEPKKVVALGCVLLGGVALVYYVNSSSDDAPQRTQRPRPVVSQTRATTSPGTARTERAPVRTRPPVAAAGREFKPSLKPRSPEEQLDPMTIDPTLRLDLIAKLQRVEVNGVKRSVFDFSDAPPREPEPKIALAKAAEEAKAKAEAEAAAKPPEPPPAPVKPPPPPINLKYYGFISAANSPIKRAFFLDGDEIFVASEGDMIRKKYKVVRIGVNSAVVEDTEHQHQQTIALTEQRG